MHLIGHAASALPFAATGHWWIAAGALAPDLTWVLNEWRFRRSGAARWEEWIDTVPDSAITPYRIAHGAPFILLATLCTYFLAPSATPFWLGWALHVTLDLPTHRGRMRQQPLFPLSRWRWRWTWTLR